MDLGLARAQLLPRSDGYSSRPENRIAALLPVRAIRPY